jgi:hypothetical protein
MAFGGNGSQFAVNTIKQNALGTQMVFADGRLFRYGQAAATQIATAKMCQQTLNSANLDELVVPTARAVGDLVVTLTTGSTAVAADAMQDGWINVEDDTGEGYLYSVATNAAAATTATLTITLNEPLQVAWTTSTTVGVFFSPFSAVIVHPSPATAMLVGVTPRIIPASNFGWFQNWGPASVTTEGTVVINEQVIDSASADGAVAPTASTAAGEENYVGVVMEVAATTEQSLVWMRLN